MDLPSLLSLAKLGCCVGSVEISSYRLAQNLGTSQQTAARKIQKLESEGYISREVRPRGQQVRLTAKGVETLKQVQQDLNKVFGGHEPRSYYITGEVSSGMGEGTYYMEIPGYKEQFLRRLGYEPYPGTLNLKLTNDEDIRLRQELQEQRGIAIDGFSHENRTFGSVKCFIARIDDTEGAVVLPSRSHYSLDTLEFIAPVKVREKAGLKDGDRVTVKVKVG